MADEHEQHSEGGGDSHKGGGGHAKRHSGPPHGGGSHEEHEGAPEWLISFADNVALMMGFFVILLAMNMAKPTLGGIGGVAKNTSDSSEAMEDFAIEVRKAFNHPVDINSTNPNEAALVKRLKQRRDEQNGSPGQPGVSGPDQSVQATRPSDWVKPTAVATFSEFDSNLTDEGKQSMAEEAARLKGQQFIVEVRGHVSAVEARDDKPKAMQLAYDRAFAAARELTAAGMSWDQLRLVGCADNERQTPRANNAGGHLSNQRVEVVVTQEQIAPDPYRDTGGGKEAGKAGGAVPASGDKRPPADHSH